jgi:O-antigen/teichoic acid export membrane protein
MYNKIKLYLVHVYLKVNLVLNYVTSPQYNYIIYTHALHFRFFKILIFSASLQRKNKSVDPGNLVKR